MKHLLNGVAIVAAIAFAAPVWAQNAPMTPSAAPKPAASAPMASAPKQMHHRPMRHAGAMRHHGKRMMGRGGDQMTDELNRQELARIQGGGPPGMAPGMAPGMPPGADAGAGQGGPRPSGH